MSFKHMRADLTVTRLAPLKVLAMSFALALALGSLNAQAQGVRAEIGNPLKQAGDLIKAGKGKEALAKVREADGVSGKTPAEQDRKSTRLNSSHSQQSRMPSSA